MSDAVALAPYPLSHEFRRRLEREFGREITYLNLAALRRAPVPTLVRTLRGHAGARFVLAFEDPASRAILPILHALAVFAGARDVAEATGADATVPVPRRTLPGALASFANATAAGVAALARCSLELRQLEQGEVKRASGGGHGRILYLNPNLWFGLKAGGSVGHIAGVVNAFSALGLEVELFSPAEPVMVDTSVQYRQLPPPQTFGLPIELNYPRFQRTAVRLAARHAEGPFDFVYQRHSVESYAGVALAHRLRLPLVLEYNGSEVWAAQHWGRPLRFERYALAAEAASLRHADLVVTVSDVLRDELVGRSVPEERVVMYPNCVDERIYDPGRFDVTDLAALRKSFGISETAVVATFIGTFGRWHGVDVLARAIRELVLGDGDWIRRHGVHFLLVGDGIRMTEVQEILSDAAIAPHLTLAGLVPQEQGAGALAVSDLLLSPHVANPDGSPFFGSPTKLFEYMAMGKGIVASALDQIADVLTPALDVDRLPSEAPARDDSSLAVLVPPGDEQALVRGIRFLVERPEWREALGRSARREALARYTWRHHVHAILDRARGLGLQPGREAVS